MEYSIGEFAKRTGLGIHTLRYYEHENLITPSRSASNRRRYFDEDIAWVDFIKRLKATGMPLKDIKRYGRLREAGDATLDERLAMLIRHRQTLRQEIRQLREHQDKLDEKIAYYRGEIARKINS